MDVAGLQVYFVSDLKSYGYTEDGEEFIGEVFFVEAEDDKGNRWRLNKSYPGVEVGHSEYGTFFQDTREEARHRCQCVIDAVTNIGRIDLAMWHATRPAYGSEAYMEYGMADDLAWEKQNG